MGARIDIRPTAAPSATVSLTHVEPDPVARRRDARARIDLEARDGRRHRRGRAPGARRARGDRGNNVAISVVSLAGDAALEPPTLHADPRHRRRRRPPRPRRDRGAAARAAGGARGRCLRRQRRERRRRRRDHAAARRPAARCGRRRDHAGQPHLAPRGDRRRTSRSPTASIRPANIRSLARARAHRRPHGRAARRSR